MADFDTTDFDAIKISIASADTIRKWSHGEVKKPETINYRTFKPEKDGLFCEKIFGPTKDWECSCGKYKGTRYKGIVCDRCGVEVTHHRVRRERMGHIDLAAPVSHIWYFKSPSNAPLARILDIKPKDLESVIYFASYIITDLDREGREADAEELREELAGDLEEIEADYAREEALLRDEYEQSQLAAEQEGDEYADVEPMTEEDLRIDLADLREEYDEEKKLRTDAFERFMTLEERDLISDQLLFTEMRRCYSTYFEGGMGAEAVRDLLSKVDLGEEVEKLRAIVVNKESKKQQLEKAMKRLEVVDAALKGGNDPANMILDVIPVIPPELRPMVPLEGGRFAASDLNDLYRRVINRNNRLKRLLELDAPAIIVNNEKRMLQESVDALFDNGRRGRAVTGRGGRALKSLAEVLKGKQGRFRQNLLGKRVDYSGRSVIVVDPHLKLHQCGLPSAMALELFKPFVLRRLMETVKGIENIKGAKRVVDRGEPIVWDVLDEVIKNRLVLLNRAPTLHRLSIQAFEPVLIEGKAIHLHPLVCKPFNADFDGDQMSVHVPLSTQAQTEARILMLSSNNLRSPASGVVQTVPSQDMVFGTYFLTTQKVGAKGEGRAFMSFEDVLSAYDNRGHVDIQAQVEVRVNATDANEFSEGRKIFRMNSAKFYERQKPKKKAGQSAEELAWEEIDEPTWQEKRRSGDKSIELRRQVVSESYDVTEHPVRITTTVGRIIFNHQCMPADYPFLNYQMTNSDVKVLVNDCCDRYSTSDVEPILDAIKQTGFHYATRAGLTVSVWDAVIPSDKKELLDEAQNKVDRINDNYENGFLKQEERHNEVIRIWQDSAETLGTKMLDGFEEANPIYMMADSGARGSSTQLRQLAGMRGLMADMKGDTIDLPIKANFREGLEPLEYFISTYGARKGLVDTASHTSDSGYLTRRLVDVAQDVIVREEDCGTDEFVTYNIVKPGETKVDTDLIGRCTLNDVVSPDGEVLIPAGGYIESAADLERLRAAGIEKVGLRALLTCKSKYGVCQCCYGWDLSTRRPVNIGTAVGIIAAQSIGEPGTQLTMRTIHSGGVAGAADITQGLPTVARMFDVVQTVNEKILGREADLAPESGMVRAYTEGNEYLLRYVDADDPSRILAEKRVPASVTFMPPFGKGNDGTAVDDPIKQRYVPVRAGDQVTYGFVNFLKLRSLTDIESTMHTFVSAVKDVYTSQSVDLNDKHIEVIARQMLRRVKVTNPADSNYLLGQYVDRYVFADTVRNITLAGGTPPSSEPAILGTMKVAASIDSWLSSASFIRTAGVLTEAAIKGDTDHLVDLKSNVIVGKKIPAGTGLKAYDDVELTYHGKRIDGPVSPNAGMLPEWAPDSLKSIEEQLPKRLEWAGDDYGFGGYSKNGRTLSSEDAKLYLFDDLGVSQRWTNKFSEVGIETVGDLIGKTEDDLLRIDGIGAKAIQELRDGLENRGLLYILEPEDDEADTEDLHQLLNMVFSPDADDDMLLGTAAPATHVYDELELIGSDTSATEGVVNETFDSVQDLYTALHMEDDSDDE